MAGLRGWLVFMGESLDKACLVLGRWVRLRPDGGTEPIPDDIAVIKQAEVSAVGGG